MSVIIVVGVRLDELIERREEKQVVKKFHEDTGVQYEKTISSVKFYSRQTGQETVNHYRIKPKELLENPFDTAIYRNDSYGMDECVLGYMIDDVGTYYSGTEKLDLEKVRSKIARISNVLISNNLSLQPHVYLLISSDNTP